MYGGGGRGVVHAVIFWGFRESRNTFHTGAYEERLLTALTAPNSLLSPF